MVPAFLPTVPVHVFEDCCHTSPRIFFFKTRESFDLCSHTEIAFQPLRRDLQGKWNTAIFDDLLHAHLIWRLPWWSSPETFLPTKLLLYQSKSQPDWDPANEQGAPATNTLSVLSFLLCIGIKVSVSMTSLSLELTGLTNSCPSSGASAHSNQSIHKQLLPD